MVLSERYEKYSPRHSKCVSHRLKEKDGKSVSPGIQFRQTLGLTLSLSLSLPLSLACAGLLHACMHACMHAIMIAGKTEMILCELRPEGSGNKQVIKRKA